MNLKQAAENPHPRPASKVWYKKWWGILIALGFWPIFAIWYAWRKSRWGNGVKIVATIVSAFFGIVFVAAASPVPPNSSSQQSAKPQTTQLAAATTASTSTPSPKSSPASTYTPSGTLKALGARTKTSVCVISGPLQDRACTPGAIFAVTAAQVCVSGYSSSVRSVSEATKNAVYAEYGIASHTTGQYEVDHLVSLELGGSNDISNLWPEPANPTPGFHQKDGVENSLHTKICNGSMSLQTAQAEIADNWLAVYNGTYSNAAPAKPVAVPTPAPAPAQTSSGSFIKMSTTRICHAPGDAYYDRTTNYTAYPTMAACIAAGGRASL